MSWYQENGEVPKYRVAIGINNVSGSAGAIDAELTLPAYLESLWSETQVDGDDIRIVDADGTTKLTYELSGWNQTTRAGTIKIDNYSAPGGGMLLVWLYWGNSTYTSGGTSVTTASPKTATVEVGAPATNLFVAQREQPGAARPRHVLAKRSSEAIFVYIDWSGLLTPLAQPVRDRFSQYEEIDYISSVTVTTSGTNQTTMYDEEKGHFLGGAMTRTLIKAGTTDTDYTVKVQVKTTLGQTLEQTIWLKVRDTNEA